MKLLLLLLCLAVPIIALSDAESMSTIFVAPLWDDVDADFANGPFLTFSPLLADSKVGQYPRVQEYVLFSAEPTDCSAF